MHLSNCFSPEHSLPRFFVRGSFTLGRLVTSTLSNRLWDIPRRLSANFYRINTCFFRDDLLFLHFHVWTFNRLFLATPKSIRDKRNVACRKGFVASSLRTWVDFPQKFRNRYAQHVYFQSFSLDMQTCMRECICYAFGVSSHQIARVCRITDNFGY